MKFSVDQATLENAIGAVIRAIPKKPTHPILANILLEADAKNQQLNFTGFDLALAIVVSCQANIQAGGKITVPAFLFSQIVSKLNGSISFEIAENNTAKIVSEKSIYSVSVMLSDEYPELPAITGKDVTRVDLDPPIIAQGLRHTFFATSIDETKQILTGVHLQLEKKLIRFISTDGHRCAVYEVNRTLADDSDSTDPHEDCQITIKNTGCAEMLKMLARAKEPVNLTFNHAYLRVTAGSSSIICRRLEGQYPRALALFPSSFATSISLDRKLFVSALQRISIVADQKNHIVKCQLDRQQREIQLSADVEGSAGLEVIAAEIVDTLPDSSDELGQEGVSLFAVNSKYFLSGLAPMESEKVQLKINTELKPIILEDGQAMKYLVMPVQVRS